MATATTVWDQSGRCSVTLKVLIVDDSPVMRSFIRRVFAVSGMDIGQPLQAENGVRALELLRDQPVDLVLTDINMPEMNGEELLRTMQADPALRATPVVVLSTDARLDRVDQMISLGAGGYITKPFTPEALRAEVERVLGVAHG
jgi:two-component system chemotaxis response regulator CheY